MSAAASSLTLDTSVEYAELHAHTNFSLLDGTSDPEDVVERAVALGLRALAITDHDSVAGIVRFAAAAKRHGVRAIIGAEVTVEDRGGGPRSGRRGQEVRASHLILLAENLAGYQN